VCVTPFLVNHGNQGGPCYAYRIEAEGRVIAYTGDTGWTETLIEAGRDADLFIAEAYFYDKKVKHHLDLATLTRHLPSIQPKLLVITHMSDDMLSRSAEIPYEVAQDGKILIV
jgi:ribonuclease BN (tRNA processing enzyme)